KKEKKNGIGVEGSPEADTGYGAGVHGGGGAPAREGVGTRGALPCRGDPETGGDGLLRDVDAGGVGRAGAGHDFVRADAGGSGTGTHGDVHGVGGDEFGGASAVAGIWERRAEEEISEAAGRGGDSGRVLPDGARGGIGRGGDSGDDGARGR